MVPWLALVMGARSSHYEVKSQFPMIRDTVNGIEVKSLNGIHLWSAIEARKVTRWMGKQSLWLGPGKKVVVSGSHSPWPDYPRLAVIALCQLMSPNSITGNFSGQGCRMVEISTECSASLLR